MRGCQLLFHLSAKNDIESERGGREVELLSLSKIPNFLQDLALTLATEKVACQKREMMRGRIFGSLSSPLSIPRSFASTLQG